MKWRRIFGFGKVEKIEDVNGEVLIIPQNPDHDAELTIRGSTWRKWVTVSIIEIKTDLKWLVRFFWVIVVALLLDRLVI